MTFLPVVGRELRVASRLPSTHWIRLIAALVALGIGGWIMLIPELGNTPGTLGIVLFVSMSILLNIYALFMGVLRTADCLSEEKREGTLGLLFLTDLKGSDIVLGKLAATSLHAFYGMLAIFPIMAISLLVGGVSGGEFWRIVIVSISNLFFSLALGMFCSAISRDERKAVALGLFLIVTFVVGLPLGGELIAYGLAGPTPIGLVRPNPLCFILSPGYATFMAFDATSKAAANFNYFSTAVTTQTVLGALFFLLACLIVPRTWHDKAQTASAQGRRAFWEIVKFGSPTKRQHRRLHLLGINPFYWLTSRDRLKEGFVWILLGAIALFWVWGLAFYPTDWRDEAAYVGTAVVVHTVLKFWLTGEACRRICLDRQSGALELLLSTPLSVGQILRGQMMSLRRQFSAPVAVVICADIVFLATGHDSEWTLTWVAGISMLVADLVTLSWVSMWLGLNTRSSTRAAAVAIARILFLPWLVFFVLLTLMAIARVPQSTRITREFLVCLWMGLGFVNDLVFGLWAARNLQTQFRLAATQRFATGSRRHVDSIQKDGLTAPT